MLLAIDCGNSETTFALVAVGQAGEKHAIEATWRVATADVSAETLGAEFATASVQGSIIANVVPDLQARLTNFVRTRFGTEPLTVHQARKQAGVAVAIESPDALGEDRLANAVGAGALYATPLVVVDFGSAVTFDCVNAEGAYVGGIIAPGINLSRKALCEGTAQLPPVDFAKTQSLLGKTTIAAMQGGLYWGYVGLVEGILTRLRQEFDYKKVIATGGQAGLLAESLPMVNAVEQSLTVYGLAELYARAQTT